SIDRLNQIIDAEQLTRLSAGVQDLNTHRFSGEYDFILSTVVMMFLERQQIPHIVQNMQDSTVRGGHN
ncbi:tellurite resistance methyltransferase TehB, partial [Enterococcus faecium]